jgi:uncharacterized membrane protein
MDEIAVVIGLLALAVLLTIGLVPYLLFSHFKLRARVRALEQLVQPSAPNTLQPAVTAVAPALQVPDAYAGPKVAVKQAPPRAFVFRTDSFGKLSAWLRENWVLAIAATSLVLAGVFMVQYGIENGLLTPFWRVVGALGFGAALIAAGEALRRLSGSTGLDGDALGETVFLPSILSGAGIVVLYVAVFGARTLYGLIGPLGCFAGLGLVSALALVLGWFYGPVLAAVGVLGAAFVPFATGGTSDASWLVQYYLAMVAAVALGIDTVKRWAWISVLGGIVPATAMALLWLNIGADVHFLAAALLVVLGMFAIPERAVIPRQGGAAFLDALLTRGRLRPVFPTRLAFGAVFGLAVAGMAVAVRANSADAVWLALVVLALLVVVTTLWTRKAPALYDHVLVASMAFLLVIGFEGLSFGPLYAQFLAASQTLPASQATPLAAHIPATVWTLSAMGLVGTGLMFQRMQAALGSAPRVTTFWAICAAVFAPATVLTLEFLWSPATVYGAFSWALAVMGVAAAMVVLASAARGDDPGAPLRIGLFAVGALTLVSLAMVLLLSDAALTVALAVMVIGTAALDRRYALPPLCAFIQIAVAIITLRLVVWPGLGWSLGWDDGAQLYLTPYLEVAFAFAVPLGLMALAWWLLLGQRLQTALVLESACWTLLGVFLAVTLLRVVPRADGQSHWVLGLMAAIWGALVVNQLYRIQVSGRFVTILRAAIAGAYGVTVLFYVAMLLGPANPLRGGAAQVIGPVVFDSLALAFLPLATVLAIAAWKITLLGRMTRIGFTLGACLFAGAYLGLEIRRLWRGTDLSVPGFSGPELYSYTLAMLIAAVSALVIAFAQRSRGVRKMAMAGVALTVVKVFLIDMAGLSGLIRVGSFMGLGLVLVGLAWLNRKMTAQWDEKARS